MWLSGFYPLIFSKGHCKGIKVDFNECLKISFTSVFNGNSLTMYYLWLYMCVRQFFSSGGDRAFWGHLTTYDFGVLQLGFVTGI